MQLEESNVPKYQAIAVENNINGQVLTSAPLSELKDVLKMTIGDWTLFSNHLKAYRSFYGDVEIDVSSINSPFPSPITEPRPYNNINSNNNSMMDLTVTDGLLADTVV